MYELKCKTPSDINEHLPILKKYAEECESVTEIGVRFVVSTWAFIEAKPSRLRCYDIMYDFFEPSEQSIKEKCDEYNIDFKFIEGDSLKIEIEQVDMLFIDTLHTYNQLFSELNRFESSVNKYIALHDTTTFGYRDEEIYGHASDLVKGKDVVKQGLMNALLDFLSINDKWTIKESFDNNNGLTILERKSK